MYPVADIYNTHLLSLNALLAVVDTIEKHCHNQITNDDAMKSDQNSGTS